jgi:putative oxidoreductase
MKSIAKLYWVFIWLGKIIQPFLLLALRLYFGWQFFELGLAKLTNPQQAIELFTANGVPSPFFTVHLVAWVEILGGIFLFLGLLARVAAIPLVIDMFAALFTVHHEGTWAFFSKPSEFLAQPPVSFLIAALVILAFGPGLFSFDALFKRALLEEK